MSLRNLHYKLNKRASAYAIPGGLAALTGLGTFAMQDDTDEEVGPDGKVVKKQRPLSKKLLNAALAAGAGGAAGYGLDELLRANPELIAKAQGAVDTVKDKTKKTISDVESKVKDVTTPEQNKKEDLKLPVEPKSNTLANLGYITGATALGAATPSLVRSPSRIAEDYKFTKAMTSPEDKFSKGEFLKRVGKNSAKDLVGKGFRRGGLTGLTLGGLMAALNNYSNK